MRNNVGLIKRFTEQVYFFVMTGERLEEVNKALGDTQRRLSNGEDVEVVLKSLIDRLDSLISSVQSHKVD